MTEQTERSLAEQPPDTGRLPDAAPGDGAAPAGERAAATARPPRRPPPRRPGHRAGHRRRGAPVLPHTAPPPLAEPRPLGETAYLAAVLRRPADRPAARGPRPGPARPRGRAAARPPRRSRDIPRLPFEPGPLPAAGTAHPRRHLGGARQLGAPDRRADRAHRPRLVPQDPRHPRPGHPRRRRAGRTCRRSTPSSSATTTTTTSTPPPSSGSRATPRCSSRPGSARWCRAPRLHPGHRARLVGGGRTARRGRPRALRLRPRAPLVQADPDRHLPLPVGRLGAHRARRAAASTSRATPATATGSRRSAAATPASTWPCCPSAPTTRAGCCGPVHTDPEEAVRACQDLGARAHGAHALGDVPALRASRRWNRCTAYGPPGRAAGRRREDLWDLPVGAFAGAGRELDAVRTATGADGSGPGAPQGLLGPVGSPQPPGGLGPRRDPPPHARGGRADQHRQADRRRPRPATARANSEPPSDARSAGTSPPRPGRPEMSPRTNRRSGIARQQAGQHHRDPPGRHQPGQHQHRHPVLAQLPLRLASRSGAARSRSRVQPARAVPRAARRAARASTARRRRGTRRSDATAKTISSANGERLVEGDHRRRADQRPRRHHRHQRPEHHQQEQRRIADRLLGRLRRHRVDAPSQLADGPTASVTGDLQPHALAVPEPVHRHLRRQPRRHAARTPRPARGIRAAAPASIPIGQYVP